MVGSQQGWGQSNGFNQPGSMQQPPNNGWEAPSYAPPAQVQQGGWNQPYPGNQPQSDSGWQQQVNQSQFDSGWQQQPFGTQPSQPQTPWGQPQMPYHPPQQTSANRTKKGLLRAALLIIVGAVILLGVFIGILATNNNQPTTANPNTPSSNAKINQSAVGKTPTSSGSNATQNATPTVMPTPTGDFPGKAFIDTPQTASKVDQTTGQVLTPTNSFATKQNIYIDFHIHAQGKDGAVCLVWYLNKQAVSDYAFAVKAKGPTQVAYAYSIYNQPGSAYVEMYWASSTTCADKQLAQHSDFTVTP